MKNWSDTRSDTRSDMRSDTRSNMRSDIKLIICQMSNWQTFGRWRRLRKNELDIMRPRYYEVNFEVRLMIIKTPQNVHKICFRGVLVTFASEVKFDLIKFTPHYVKFFFPICHVICTPLPPTPAPHPQHQPHPNEPACVILTLLDILNVEK